MVTRMDRVDSAIFSLPSEQILLSQPRIGTEVHPPKMGDLGRLPAGQTVVPAHRGDDPDIDGESFQLAGAKEQDAVGDLLSDARQMEQPGFGRGVGQPFRFLQPAGVLSEKPGGLVHIAGPEAQLAGPQLGFGERGELGPGREPVERVVPNALALSALAVRTSVPPNCSACAKVPLWPIGPAWW